MIWKITVMMFCDGIDKFCHCALLIVITELRQTWNGVFGILKDTYLSWLAAIDLSGGKLF